MDIDIERVSSEGEAFDRGCGTSDSDGSAQRAASAQEGSSQANSEALAREVDVLDCIDEGDEDEMNAEEQEEEERLPLAEIARLTKAVIVIEGRGRPGGWQVGIFQLEVSSSLSSFAEDTLVLLM